jgi:hypothetical protein
MSIAGYVLIGCISLIFVTFLVVLAWGVHQTNFIQRDKDNVADFATKETQDNDAHSQAA